MPQSDGTDIVKSLHSSRVPDRLYLELESGERLQISPDIALEYDLHQGRELDGEELEALRRDASRDSAKARALRILAARPMSEGELKDRLRRKGESGEDAENAAQLMRRVGFVDDEEYANMVVRSCAGKGYGAARAKNELIRRKVPREYWDSALAQLPEPDDTLDRLIAAKAARGLDDTARRRLTDSLLRRGFSREDVRAALMRYDTENDYSEEYI